MWAKRRPRGVRENPGTSRSPCSVSATLRTSSVRSSAASATDVRGYLKAATLARNLRYAPARLSGWQGGS